MDPEQDLALKIKNANHLEVIRHIRAFKLREPDLVLHHGTLHLQQPSLLLPPTPDESSKPKKSTSSIFSAFFSKSDQSEHLATLEQITIAALDTNSPTYAPFATTIAERTLTQIRDVVGRESVRYRQLLALCLERQENYDGALSIYDNLVTENPSNVHALRRKYAVLRARQYSFQEEEKDEGEKGAELARVVEIKEALNGYLERNGCDASGWMEMTKICAEIGDYSGAAYSAEEIVLSSPLNAEAHCALGEWYATVGGRDNWKAARKHFAQSLDLDAKNNLRALMGLVNAAESYLYDVENGDGSSSSGTSGGVTGKKKKKKELVDEEDVEMARDLLKYGTDKLLAMYKGSPMSGLMETVLEDMKR